MGTWKAAGEIEQNLVITCEILEDLMGRWEEGCCGCAEVGEVGSEEQMVDVEGEGWGDSWVYKPVWEVGCPTSGCLGGEASSVLLDHGGVSQSACFP